MAIDPSIFKFKSDCAIIVPKRPPFLKLSGIVAPTMATVKTPIPPVPALATGPVYHTWDIEGIIIPT